jgi:hypothetical protein
MSRMGSYDPLGHLQHKLWQKKKARNQISSLTPNHEMSRINLISVHVGGVRHTIGKISTRATTLFQPHPD